MGGTHKRERGGREGGEKHAIRERENTQSKREGEERV